MPTNNFYIGESDGWVQIADGPVEVHVSGSPETHPYYLYAGPSTPGDTVEGILVECVTFHTMNKMADKLYARVIDPVPNAAKLDGRLRLDVFTIISSGPVVDSFLLLEDNTSFLLLEDNTSIILLEA